MTHHRTWTQSAKLRDEFSFLITYATRFLLFCSIPRKVASWRPRSFSEAALVHLGRSLDAGMDLATTRDAVGSAYGQGQREFKDGVLTVTLPKTQATLSRVKKIKVQRTEVSGRYPEHAAGLVRRI